MRHPPTKVVALALVLSACGNNGVGKSHPQIRADPQTLNFGNQPQGTKATLSVTLYNDGAIGLTISGYSIAGDARNAFSGGGLATTIAAGASAAISVSYQAPSAEGPDGATLTIESNADNAPELDISLSGRSVAACVPETDNAFCTRVGKNCGQVNANDNCGTSRTVTSCGTCTSPQTCGGKGIANICDTPVFAVAVTLAGNGTGTVTSTPTGISCPGSCSANFSSGTTVSLTPAGTNGSTFAGFSGDCSGATCSLGVSAAKNVTATFTKTHTLTVTALGTGSGTISSNTTPAIACTATAGSASGTCTAELPEGTSITLNPSASSGSRFDSWSGACTTSPCTFTLDADATATASFVQTWDVNVTFAGSGAGTVAFGAGTPCTASCTRTFDAGTTLSIGGTASTATPNRFAGFSGDYSGAGPYSIASLAAGVALTATFVSTVDVNVTFAGSGSGTVDFGGLAATCSATCTRTFDAGTSVTLGGTAGGGNSFSGFTGDCSGNPSCTMASITNPAKAVTATFDPAATFTIGGTVTGLSSGLTLKNGSEQLPITSNGTFTFTSKASSYSVSVFTQPSAPAQTCTVTNASGTATGDVTDVQVDCPPFALASSLYGPIGAKVFGANVYFATSSNGSCYGATGTTGDNVMLVPAAGGGTTTIAAIEHSGGNCGFYGPAFDSSYVYWANYSNGAIGRATLAGTGATDIGNGGGYTNSFIADTSGTYLYYFGYSHYEIGRQTVAGTGATKFTAISSINSINLAVDANYLYWTDGSTNAVRKGSLTATLPIATPTDISTSESSPFAPFATASVLYWINSGGTVRKAALPAGSAADLSTGLSNPGSLVADASYVYVLAGGGSATDGRLYKIPVGGGAAVIIAKNLNQPNSISMDAGHLYWSNFGTSGVSDGAILMIVK